MRPPKKYRRYCNVFHHQGWPWTRFTGVRHEPYNGKMTLVARFIEPLPPGRGHSERALIGSGPLGPRRYLPLVVPFPG